MLVDLQCAVVDEARAATDAVRRRHRVDAVEHESDEAVALALDPFHHRTAVDSHRAVETNPEIRPSMGRVRGIGRGDEQLARHAPDAGARRAVRAVLDQDGVLAGSGRGAIRGDAGRAGADDGHIH